MSDLFAPRVAVFVEGQDISEEISEFTPSITVEDTIDLTSQIRIILSNPNLIWTQRKMFRPGNEIRVYLGYGTSLRHVGSGELIRHLPHFPSDGIPTLELVAHDPSWRMKKEGLLIEGPKRQKKKRRSRYDEGEIQNLWEGSITDQVSILGYRYGLNAIVDSFFDTKLDKFRQRKGITDYQMLKAMANFYDAEVFIRFDAPDPEIDLKTGALKVSSGQWNIHFRRIYSFDLKSDTAPIPPKLKFTYRESDTLERSIIDLDLRWAIDDAISEVQTLVWDPATGEWLTLTIEHIESGKDDPILKVNESIKKKASSIGDSGVRVKLAAAGHSIHIFTRPFENALDAYNFSRKFFEQYRDLFILAEGTLIGHEELRAGDVYALAGLADYSGDYYFSDVVHQYDASGYITKFKARRVVKEVAP